MEGDTSRISIPFFFLPPSRIFPRVPSPCHRANIGFQPSLFPPPPLPSGSLIKRKLLAASCHRMLGRGFDPPSPPPFEKSSNRNALNRITFEGSRESEGERVAFPPEHPSSRAVHLETKRSENPKRFAYALSYLLFTLRIDYCDSRPSSCFPPRRWSESIRRKLARCFSTIRIVIEL